MEEKKLEISVLITFYNQEKYVNKTIDSVIRQKVNFPFEIIIGDDGSSDSTFDLIKKWTYDYPDVIKAFCFERDESKYIGGFRASQNRLKLLKEVKGNYFIFLDGDDYYIDENKLQKQFDVLNNSDNYDCIACGHNMEMLYEDGTKKTTTSSKLVEGKIIPKNYWKNYYIHTDALLFRSKIIKYIDIDLVKNNFNDNLITFLAIQHGNIYYLTDVMAVYYQSSNGIWTGNKKIINHIRNIFLYDLCNIINSDFSKETNRRFAYSWYVLYRNRRFLNSSISSALVEEAKTRNLKNSLKWLNYNNLSLFEKIKMCIKSLFGIRWLILDRLFCH